MEINCSFQRLVGGCCSKGRRSRVAGKTSLMVPLRLCEKDISAHKQAVGVNDVESEVDLILARARASIFTLPSNISDMTICPAHRSSLGIGWRRGSQRCRVPSELSRHAKEGKSRKGDRGINKALSKAILRRTGIFLPVGSGICRDCRTAIVPDTKITVTEACSSSIAGIAKRIENVSLDYAGVPHSTPITPGGSFYIPESDDTCTSFEVTFDDLRGAQAEHKPADALNEYLQSRDTSPVRSRLNTPWEIASERTKRYYIRKAGQGVTAIMEDIAPKSPAELFQAMCSSQAIQRTLSSDEETETTVDETLLGALADCYHAAGCWETRRQILSIMADKVSFKKLRLWIPDLSSCCFTEAKRHCLTHGRGAPVSSA
ncbi:unnamed protein product [Pocillopora meandrina]|uniref:Uncharacterized protein n=1 Tax=Pocillopora meandrina TaxID=46732 RepID=A0AAU9XV03_9CNID|nr:unnamed protein product [Pocillopora meandrina]